MSTTTYRQPLSWIAPTNSDHKNMIISVQELPTTDLKYEAKPRITPVLPYDEELREFLEKSAPSDDDASSVYSIPTIAIEKKQKATVSLPIQTAAAVADPQTKEDGQSKPMPRFYLSRRERLRGWWAKERAEQKAFNNAMASYYAF